MSVVFATQLTAVATLALAVLALATAVLALLAWRKQSREVRDQAEMLRLQAEEFRQLSADRERDAVVRRRAQAAQVYAWQTWVDDAAVFHVRNTSQQPIYYLHFEWQREPVDLGVLQGYAEPLMPGEERATTDESRTADDFHIIAALFYDSAGVWWRIRWGAVPEEVPPHLLSRIPSPDPGYDRPLGEGVPEEEVQTP